MSFILDTAEINPCQLAPTVGTLGVGVMKSTAFLPSSKIDGNQVTFGTVDFQTDPPTIASVFARLDQEIDLTIRSFNFRVGSLGSLCFSDLIPLGLSAGKTTIAATSETSDGSSSKVNLPASIKSAESNRNIIDKLDEIMEKL
jgi:hypothetical protein